MGMIEFFAGIANNFLNRYQQLADSIQYRPTRQFGTPDNSSTPTSAAKTDKYQPSAATAAPAPSDTVELSGKQPTETTTQKDTPMDSADQKQRDTAYPSTDVRSDGTYFVQRQAQLDYRLDLEFDLAAVQRTVQYMADGNTQAVEQLAAGGFGLSADFKLSGSQAILTNMTDGSKGQMKGAESYRSRQASAFSANSRNFAADSFSRESSRLTRSYHQINQDGFSRAVNKFSFRYRMDSGFSFGFMDRFQVQTDRMATEMPDQVNQYVDTAGSVAENGSSAMMASFFDAVDGYLGQAESSLLENAVASFEQAAAELGFSGAAVDAVKTHLTDSIEGFFDRVDTAMGSIRSQFGVESQPKIEPSTPDIQPAVPSADPAVSPETEQAVAV